MSVLEWLAQDQMRYWLVASALLLLFFTVSLRPRWLRDRMWPTDEGVLYFVALGVVFFAFRWPAIAMPTPLNPDEAQMAAQALAALSDPMPWRGFDPTTSGPLSSYLLALPAFLGLPITFEWAHFAGTLLLLLSTGAFYVALCRLVPASIARAATLVPVLFFAFTQSADFVHYSSEVLPVALLLGAFAAFACIVTGDAPELPAALGGLALGATAFSKLQALPLAALLGVLTLVCLARSAAARRHRSIVLFCGGILFWPFAFLCLTLAGGSLRDAWISYVQANLVYVGDSRSLPDLASYFGAQSPMRGFLLGWVALLLVTVAIVAVCRQIVRRDLERLGIAVLFAVVAIGSVEFPHRAFPHYFLLALFPLSGVIAALLSVVYRALGEGRRARIAAVSLTFLVLGGSLWPASTQMTADYRRAFAENAGVGDPVAAMLQSITIAGEPIVVWGWMPQYYVYTQTRMAAIDANVVYQVVSGPLQDYYRSRFLRSMQRRRPSLFVDAVTPSSFYLDDPMTERFEVVPQLRAYVQEHYRLLADFRGVRVFVRDRDAAIPGDRSRGHVVSGR